MERSDVTSADPAPQEQEPGADLAQHLEQLDTLAERPLDEHVGVFEKLHECLQEQLANIEHG